MKVWWPLSLFSIQQLPHIDISIKSELNKWKNLLQIKDALCNICKYLKILTGMTELVGSMTLICSYLYAVSPSVALSLIEVGDCYMIFFLLQLWYGTKKHVSSYTPFSFGIMVLPSIMSCSNIYWHIFRCI